MDLIPDIILMNIHKHRPTPRLIAQKAERFARLRSVEDFARLVAVPQHKLLIKAHYPEYRHLELPKPGGSVRKIEDPSKKLKRVQRALNNHLQCVYYHIRTDAAYGFMLNAWQDPAPRNIVSNARRHLGCRMMLNMDFTDFFHQIRTPSVYAVLKRKPFRFDDDLIDLLCRLMTYHGRLPMGAPTSPILSNYACIPLDTDLLALARRRGWTYTRFADDLTFSTSGEIRESDIPAIRDYARIYGFSFNEKKTVLYGRDDPKYVTGLQVDSDISIPQEFLSALQEDTDRLRRIRETQMLYGMVNPVYLEHFVASVEGKIRFVEYVLGKHDPELHALRKGYHTAMNPDIPPQMMRWSDFPYARFI